MHFYRSSNDLCVVWLLLCCWNKTINWLWFIQINFVIFADALHSIRPRFICASCHKLTNIIVNNIDELNINQSFCFWSLFCSNSINSFCCPKRVCYLLYDSSGTKMGVEMNLFVCRCVTEPNTHQHFSLIILLYSVCNDDDDDDDDGWMDGWGKGCCLDVRFYKIEFSCHSKFDKRQIAKKTQTNSGSTIRKNRKWTNQWLNQIWF